MGTLNQKEYKFNDCYKLGKNGEDKIIDFLSKNKNISNISNVTNNLEYQKKDIDLVVTFESGKIHNVEIKTDSYSSGNLFIETLSNIDELTLGCAFVTQADFLFYYFINTKELYIIKMNKFIPWLLLIMKDLKSKSVINKWGNNHYSSCGVLLPKKTLENNFKYYQKFKII